MSSQDVRDMLDLPGDAPRPAKKQKIAGPKTMLKGLAREVQNLGGDNPIAIVPELSVFKKRRFGSRKPAAKWDLKPFKNSAREDQSLVLRHWRRVTELLPVPNSEETMTGLESKDAPEIEDSSFAKYNVRVTIPKYDDELYNSHLQSDEWTRDETDYLMDLVQEYDLRWPVIWDRYDYQSQAPSTGTEAGDSAIASTRKARSLEDIKERYYKVSAEIMKATIDQRFMNNAEFNLLELMQNFNKNQEIARKKFAEAAFHRTKDEAREEENLLLELRRILARSEKLTLERQELYARLETPPTHGNISGYTSSQGLQQLLTSLVQADKIKRNKSFSGPAVSPATAGGVNAPTAYDDPRRNSSVRESLSGPSGGNKKAITGPTDRRQLSPEEESLFGVRHFDRIPTTGPAFRQERILKPYTNKSATQKAKIDGVLSELRIPQRLLMPTHRVGEAFEGLLQDINLLLDQRKMADKLQGEINLLKSLKQERQKEQEKQKEQIARAEPGDPKDEGVGAVGIEVLRNDTEKSNNS